MKSTNTNEYKEAIEQYILSCITSEDVELTTRQEKLDYLFSEFNRVSYYPHNLHRFPNDQDRLANYLQGLPFSFEYTNYEILKLAERLHECTLTEKQEKTILRNYWSHIALHLLRMKSKERRTRAKERMNLNK